MTNIEKQGYRPTTIRIYTKDKQLFLEDQVLCAYEMQSKKILAIGQEALTYVQDDRVAVVNPLKWGVVADYMVFNKVITQYIKKLPTTFCLKPVVALCVPAKLTEVERKVFWESVETVVRKPYYLIEKSFEQLLADGLEADLKGVNYYIEFVSEYYASEYFV